MSVQFNSSDQRWWRDRVESRLGSTLRSLRLAMVLIAMVAACGGDDDAGTTLPPATTTTTIAATTSTTATATTVDAGITVFGWLKSFDDTGAGVHLMVDEAEMLSGDAALAAAREDGVVGADEDLPNDYYIRNPDSVTSELVVSPDVVVTLQACYETGDCVTTEQVDLATWSVLLGSEDDPGLAWTWYGAGSLPYWFTLEGDSIISIEEQYLP